MIYIVGDTHRMLDNEVLTEKYFKKHNINIDDIEVAIVLGDFGVPWVSNYEDDIDSKIIKAYAKLPFNILAVPGNHDNYDFINNVAMQQKMYGDVVYRVSSNVFYLKRGAIYTISDKTFLCLGGAHSIDKSFRTPRISWWPEEQWSVQEEYFLFKNLKKTNNKVDYVISHTGPSKIIEQLDPRFAADIENIMSDHNVAICDYIYDNVKFKHFYFGHWHIDGIKTIENATQIYKSHVVI